MASIKQCALLRLLLPFLLVVSFTYATSVVSTTHQVPGNEVNTVGKLVDEEAKFKGFKSFPKPIPKPIPVLKPVPIPVPFVKPIPKPVPIEKPIPILKPVPIFKPVPFVKPIPKPFEVKKPIPTLEQEEFLKPKPFFKKPIPKLPLHPKFEKPHFPIHKPIPSP